MGDEVEYLYKENHIVMTVIGRLRKKINLTLPQETRPNEQSVFHSSHFFLEFFISRLALSRIPQHSQNNLSVKKYYSHLLQYFLRSG